MWFSIGLYSKSLGRPIDPFSPSLNKDLLGTYFVPGTTLGTGDAAVNRMDKNSCPHGDYTLAGETDNKINKNVHRKQGRGTWCVGGGGGAR